MNVQILLNLHLKSVLSRLVQINFKSYFLHTNSTWGQLHSEELTPLDLKWPSRLWSTFGGRLPGVTNSEISQLCRNYVKTVSLITYTVLAGR